MKCPNCGAPIPGWWLPRITQHSFVSCPACKTQLGRRRGSKLLAVLAGLAPIPLLLADDGYLSWSVAVFVAVVWTFVLFYIDSSTVKLVQASELGTKPLSRRAARFLGWSLALSTVSCLTLGFLARFVFAQILAERSTAALEVLLALVALLAMAGPMVAIFALDRLKQKRLVLVSVLFWVIGVTLLFQLFAQP